VPFTVPFTDARSASGAETGSTTVAVDAGAVFDDVCAGTDSTAAGAGAAAGNSS